MKKIVTLHRKKDVDAMCLSSVSMTPWLSW